MDNHCQHTGIAPSHDAGTRPAWVPVLFGYACLAVAIGVAVGMRDGAGARSLATAAAVPGRVVSPEVSPGPILDMHLHALPADFNGPPPVRFCTGDIVYPGVDPRSPFGLADLIDCRQPILSVADDEQLMRRTLEILERNDMRAVTSGPIEHVRRWRAAAPDRIIPALMLPDLERITPDDLRRLIESGDVAVVGEVMTQYQGMSATHADLDPYLGIAEELDVPVALHVGMGPPGVAYLGRPDFRASLTDPLQLEEALLRHPRLRLSVMHAGWPMLDEMIHLLYSHPQVYVDIGIISWGIPRAEFHRYLRRLVEAGFGERIMFGSDQIVWPEAIEIAIDAVATADFLTDSQRRDIFYDNAARFLRLDGGRDRQRRDSPVRR